MAKPINYSVTLSEIEAKEFLTSLSKGPSEAAKEIIEAAKKLKVVLKEL
ncbi:MAG: hypothetical protein NTY90_00090 [Candidatus Micrarchaeota archaeon]|nr:hypothetical protein [Candidatus Micrarchaeota archaeon]